MWRAVGAVVAVLAFLAGLSAAPYTHAHRAIDSASDERHPHGDTLVHSHASPHAHEEAEGTGRAPADTDHDSEQIWSVKSFVFQPSLPHHVPSPVLQALGEPPLQRSSTWLSADRLEPRAHGPPIGSPSGLRAPPAFLPTSA